MDKKSPIIIDITEIYDIRDRKSRELMFYQQELEKLRMKMVMIEQEIKLTNNIIHLIETENVIDLQEYIRENKK